MEPLSGESIAGERTEREKRHYSFSSGGERVVLFTSTWGKRGGEKRDKAMKENKPKEERGVSLARKEEKKGSLHPGRNMGLGEEIVVYYSNFTKKNVIYIQYFQGRKEPAASPNQEKRSYP